MGDRIILHSDMNSFYASVEMLHHPGVKTGMALWQAK